MYEEIKIRKRIDWKSFILKMIVLLIVVFIICAVCFNTKHTYAKTPLNSETKALLKAGKKYYIIDKLPNKIGRSSKVSLNELIKENYISNKKYHNCDLNNSYVKVTKVGKKEYSIYSYLKCNTDENTIVDSINTLTDNEEVKVKSYTKTYENNEIINASEDDFTIQVIE